MIPKIIHYCWFGEKTKPKIILDYIKSWSEKCPDYKIKEWNEDIFDIDKFQFTREAYENKKYAFVSDVCRLYALYIEGGIYFDTDVEVLKSFDPLLSNNVFIGLENEKDNRIGTSVIGTEPYNCFIKSCLTYYEKKGFINADGSFNTKPNTLIISEILKSKNWNNIMLYPTDYFSPIDFETKHIRITENTYSIHHYAGTWLPKYRQYESRFWSMFRLRDKQILYKIFHKLHLEK